MAELLQQEPAVLDASGDAFGLELELPFIDDDVYMPDTAPSQRAPGANTSQNAISKIFSETPVSKLSVLVTAFGLLCYVVDMGTDMYTAAQFGYGGHWRQCVLTLLIVYATVAISTVSKWLQDAVRCTGPLGKLRFLASLLVNWPDVQQCWTLLHLEWKLCQSPTSDAQLVSKWEASRVRVAALKFTEGVCEACPQAILQLVLLLPELRGDVSVAVAVRMVATAMSFCTAGAALVNWEKLDRFFNHTALPLGELAVLHAWAVPVTVSRLLCLVLLLSLHLYVGLGCLALHLVLYWIYWCSAVILPRTRHHVFDVFLHSVLFLISPFDDSIPCPSHPVRHVAHFVGNAGVTVVWALYTPLFCTQPTLYAALITMVAGMFVTGLLVWLLHRKCYKRPTPPSKLTGTPVNQQEIAHGPSVTIYDTAGIKYESAATTHEPAVTACGLASTTHSSATIAHEPALTTHEPAVTTCGAAATTHDAGATRHNPGATTHSPSVIDINRPNTTTIAHFPYPIIPATE